MLAYYKMSTVALPRNLIAPAVLKGDDRIKSSSVKILPANAGNLYTPTGSNRIIFNVPAYSKSFLNGQRSYVSFTIKKTGNEADSRLVDGIPWLQRMTLKCGTTLCEDLDEYALLEKMESLYESSDNAEGRAWLNGDYSDVLRKYSGGSGLKAETILDRVIAEEHDGRTFTKPLLSGIIGKGQQFYVPISYLNSSGSQAIQIELYLNSADQVVTRNTGVTSSPSYELSDVSLNLEVCELPERALSAISKAVHSGGSITLPYKSYRVFKQYVPSGQEHVAFNVVENSKDAEKMMVALRPQEKTSGYTTADVNGSTDDAFKLVGGENTNTVISKFGVRYGTTMYPPAPVEVRLGRGTTPVVLAGLASCDMLNKSTRMTSIDTDGRPLFENSAMMIVTGFKTSEDQIENGLNTAFGGAPIELNLDFSANTNNLSMYAFIKSNYHLNITPTGGVTMTEGSQ